MKKILMPYVAKMLSSDALLNAKRISEEWRRKLSKQAHCIDVFIALDDPYSAILIQVLPEFLTRFDVICTIHIVRDKQAEMFPDLHKWQRNSLIDANRLAALYGLHPLSVPNKGVHSSQYYLTQLITACEQQDIKQCIALFLAYWGGEVSAVNTSITVEKEGMLKANFLRLQQLGHYLTATIYYGGEWYWGIDRLDHLESRFNSLGLSKVSPMIKYKRTWTQHSHPSNPYIANNKSDKSFDMYYSARSPYSYIGLEKAAAMAARLNVTLNIKPVMPMMMRGVNVPNSKKMYIFHDTKREAKKLGLEYGHVADPLGQAVINCYAMYPYAVAQAKELQYLLSFSRAVNSQGIRADMHSGLQRIIEAAGLDWHVAKQYLANEEYKTFTQQNINELSEHGLWGVPCYRYQDIIVWGQDRLWVIEQALNAHHVR